jgi:hypothetical protein
LGKDDYAQITELGRLPDPSHYDNPVMVDHLNRIYLKFWFDFSLHLKVPVILLFSSDLE